MSSTTTRVPPASALKACAKRTFDEMSKEDLIQELEARDMMIAQLRKEHALLQKAATSAIATKSASGLTTTASTTISPEKAAEKAGQLTKIAVRGIKSQMKWKPSCKYGTARWSFTAFCDEPTFRAFMKLTPKDKTKGGKMPIEEFEALLGQGISTSIRYGYLCLRNDTVNITYNKTAGEIKITGAYGM